MYKLIVTLVILGCAFAEVPSAQDGARIIGGSPALNGQYPHMVSIKSQNKHFCGGSIISPNWILTSAHCVYGVAPSALVVQVGSNLLNAGGINYKIAQVIPHQQFNQQVNFNDIALLRVSGNIAYNKNVQPISLANNIPPGGIACAVSGWGVLNDQSNNIPNGLQHLFVTTVTNAQCQKELPKYPIYNSNICTKAQYGQGACRGDPGNPLVCSGSQFGILSWAPACAKGNPDIYTSVASYRNWIKQYTGF